MSTEILGQRRRGTRHSLLSLSPPPVAAALKHHGHCQMSGRGRTGKAGDAGEVVRREKQAEEGGAGERRPREAGRQEIRTPQHTRTGGSEDTPACPSALCGSGPHPSPLMSKNRETLCLAVSGDEEGVTS